MPTIGFVLASPQHRGYIIFQHTMEQLLRDIPGALAAGVCCYLDYILISGPTCGEHDTTLLTLRRVLTKLQSAGLKLSLEKCSIGMHQVEYLGFLLDKDGLHPPDEKIKAIRDAPQPTNVTQVRAYLGLINFYRRFLPKASSDPIWITCQFTLKIVCSFIMQNKHPEN